MVKQRGKSSKKPLVKGKGSAKKRVSKRRSSKVKKTPKAHGRLTNIVEEAISTSPYKKEYEALKPGDKDAIKAELEIEAAKKKYQNLSSSELGKALDDILARRLDL